MELYVTRHGQTDWNVQQKVQGKADISLNDKGRKQAKETAKKLKSEKIDLIICSPLKRAKETAQAINKGRNIPVIYDDKISERDFGEFEGKQKDQFDFQGFWSYKQNQHYEKAEDIRNFFKRVYSMLDEITDKYQGKRLLIVSHGGVSIPIECYFNGIPNQESLLNLAIGNCEVKRYYIEREQELEEER